MLYGPDRLLADLLELGHRAEKVTAANDQIFVVIRNYAIALGKFAGREIDLGLQATADFPKTVASAIHVRANPQLYEKADSVPNARNITDSALGSEWRYWSNNFGWSGERTARQLMAQVNRIFHDA
jgi:hypothetical protein